MGSAHAHACALLARVHVRVFGTAHGEGTYLHVVGLCACVEGSMCTCAWLVSVYAWMLFAHACVDPVRTSTRVAPRLGRWPRLA